MQAIASGRFREDLYYRLNTVPIAVPALRERPEDIYLLFRKFASDVAVQYRMPAISLDAEARALLESYGWRGNVRQLKNVAEQISAIEESRTITAPILAKYLTEQRTTSAPSIMGSAQMDDMGTERELLYKVLFDMRNDINDLKRMMMEMRMGGAMPMQPMQPMERKEVIGLLPGNNRPAIDDYAESEEIIDEPRELTKADVQREQIIRALRRHNGRRKDAAAELFMSERTLYRKIKDLGIE